MSVRGVFLVNSPLQVVNATEARATYGLTVDDALLVTGPVRGELEGERQMQQVIERCEWRALTLDDPWQADVGPDAVAFIGDYRRPWLRAAARAIGPRRHPVLLDDGNATVLLAARRRRPWWRLTDPSSTWAKGRLHHWYPVPGLVKDLREPSSREHRSVEFFSIYSLRLRRTDTSRLNWFDVLRGDAPPRVERRPVFVGSSWVESGLVTAEAYERVVSSAADRFGPGVLYIAHRAESEETLQRLRLAYGLEIVRPHVPIEIFLVDSGVLPDPLVGMLSSAFDSMSVVFPEMTVERNPPEFEELMPRYRAPMWRFMQLATAAELFDRPAPATA